MSSLRPAAGAVLDDLEIGGRRAAEPDPSAADGWRVTGDAAVVLAPRPLPPTDHSAARKQAEERAKERRRRERAPLGG